MTYYQAYEWNGKEYRIFGVPRKSKRKAIRDTEVALMLGDVNSEIETSVFRFWKEKEIIVKEVEL